MELRELSRDERVLLDFLLSSEIASRDALVAQAETVKTKGLTCTCGCPSFSLEPDRSQPRADVGERIVSDAHGLDGDGHLIGVMLFVDDGYLSEVEVYSVDGSGFGGLPDPTWLELG